MKKNIIKILTFLLIAFIAIKFAFGIYNDIKLQRKIKQQFVENQKKYEKLKEEKERLKKELEQARTEENKERVLRDKLNMKKEGERVYKILEDESEKK